MQKLFKEQKVSLYQIQNDLGLDVKRLYRYANGSCKVKNMPIELLQQLSQYLCISEVELFNKMIEYQERKK